MTFTIDTGSDERAFATAWSRIYKCDIILAGVMDALPENPPQSAIDAGIVAAVLGDMHAAKMLETVREHLLQMWPLLARLAETDPDGFDECIVAFAELTTSLPADRSEAIARRKAARG